MTTTAIYARISDDRLGDAAGVARQLDDCRALVKQRHWGEAAEYVDNHRSAWKRGGARPAYRKLLESVRAGEVDRLVVYNLDRLYRQVRELEEIIDLAEAGRVQIVSLSGDLDLSNGDGRAMARVMVTMAQKASDDASRRQKRKQVQRREQGQYHGGPRAFGWLNGTEPHPTESKLVIEAADYVLESGGSLCDIAHRWEQLGLPHRTSGRTRGWNTTDVRRVLVNPRHAGLLVHRGQLVGQGAWKPLLDREKWERLCGVLDGRATNVGVPRRRRMFTGVLFCGGCGQPLNGSARRHGEVDGPRVWRCDGGKPGGRHCGRVCITAEPVEAILVEATFQRIDNLDLAAAVADKPDSEGAQWSAALVAAEDRVKQLGASFGQGKLPLAAFEAATAALQAEQERLRGKLAALRRQDVLAPYVGRPGVLRAAWDSLTDDQRRSIILDAIGCATVLPASRRGCRFDPSRVVIGHLPPLYSDTAAARRAARA